jgi:hypothetical protein
MESQWKLRICGANVKEKGFQERCFANVILSSDQIHATQAFNFQALEATEILDT